MTQAKLPRLPRATGPEALAAEHVAAVFSGRFRSSPALGWLAWDGRRWAASEAASERALDAVRLLVKGRVAEHEAESAVRALDAEQLIRDALGDDPRLEKLTELSRDDQDALVADRPEAERLAELRREQDAEREQSGIWLNMLQLGKLLAILKITAGMPGVLTEASELDQHPDLLNVGNGVVDLRTGELADHDPALLMTKLAGADYVPGATDPLWEAALVAVPEGVQPWLQLRFGQSATGHRPDDDVMLVNCGGGENGKTTVISAVMRALGEYAGLVPHKALMGGDARAHTTELMTFRGLRMAVLEETPEEGRLDVHRVKMTVGTPEITARLVRRDNVTFPTTHTMWINTNHMPQVTATDHGTWRRLVAVPWPYRFTADPTEANERQGDRTLRPRLVDAPTANVGAAVLAWVVAGAVRWYESGRVSPEHPTAVLEASNAWRRESDVALAFASEHLVADPAGFITPTDLLDAVNEFLEDQNRPTWGGPTLKTRMGDALAALGIRDAAPRTGRVKAGMVQSVRARQVSTWSPGPAAKVYDVGDAPRAWWGVRFRRADDGHLKAASA